MMLARKKKEEEHGLEHNATGHCVVDNGNNVGAEKNDIDDKSNNAACDAQLVLFTVVAAPFVVFSFVVDALNTLGQGLAHLLGGEELQNQAPNKS